MAHKTDEVPVFRVIIFYVFCWKLFAIVERKFENELYLEKRSKSRKNVYIEEMETNILVIYDLFASLMK